MKKLFSIFLAAALLISNVGYAVSTHYCDGKAVKKSITIAQPKLDCGMEKAVMECKSSHEITNIKTKDCCQNKHLKLSIEDDFNSNSIVKHSINFQFVVATIATQFNFFDFDASDEVKITDYVPIKLNLDIPIMVQSFLL